MGELVAAPALPIQVRLDREALWPGAELTGGEQLVSVSTGEPTFFMDVTASQEKLIPAGTFVRVSHGDVTWQGVLGDWTPSDIGARFPIHAAEGGLLCADQCGQLPATGETNLLTEVLVVPPERGPVVPVAAITTQPDGSTAVLVVGGSSDTPTPVTVRTVADGLAVVDGEAVGSSVRVFGRSPEPSPEPG